jgi:hypothetical protein
MDLFNWKSWPVVDFYDLGNEPSDSFKGNWVVWRQLAPEK